MQAKAGNRICYEILFVTAVLCLEENISQSFFLSSDSYSISFSSAVFPEPLRAWHKLSCLRPNIQLSFSAFGQPLLCVHLHSLQIWASIIKDEWERHLSIGISINIYNAVWCYISLTKQYWASPLANNLPSSCVTRNCSFISRLLRPK